MKTVSFVLVEPIGESPYVRIDYTGYPTAQSGNQSRIYDTEKVVIKRDLNSDSFSLVINGDLFINFLESEVTAPAHSDANDLHNKLCALFGKNPSVNVLIPNPLPITGNVDVDNFPAEFGVVNGSTPLHVTVDSVSPNPLPVTGTVGVSNFPATQTVMVTPNPLPVTGTVGIIQTGHLFRRYGALSNVPQLVKLGASETFCLKAINAGAARQFVKFCDSVLAPTVGVTPVLATFDVPANGTVYLQYADTPIVTVNGLWVYTVRGFLDNDVSVATPCICEINYR